MTVERFVAVSACANAVFILQKLYFLVCQCSMTIFSFEWIHVNC